MPALTKLVKGGILFLTLPIVLVIVLSGDLLITWAKPSMPQKSTTVCTMIQGNGGNATLDTSQLSGTVLNDINSQGPFSLNCQKASTNSDQKSTSKGSGGKPNTNKPDKKPKGKSSDSEPAFTKNFNALVSNGIEVEPTVTDTCVKKGTSGVVSPIKSTDSGTNIPNFVFSVEEAGGGNCYSIVWDFTNTPFESDTCDFATYYWGAKMTQGGSVVYNIVRTDGTHLLQSLYDGAPIKDDRPYISGGGYGNLKEITANAAGPQGATIALGPVYIPASSSGPSCVH